MGRKQKDMNLQLDQKLQDFRKDFVADVNTLEQFLTFLAVTPDEREAFNTVMKILKKRSKSIKECKSSEDIMRYIKGKKFMEAYLYEE